MNSSKTKRLKFTFDEDSFVHATETSVPGLFTLATPEGILCARRGGAWYSPRGTEAEACLAALDADLRSRSKEGRSQDVRFYPQMT